jgi:non-specific serine/threonine protein kinase/serine/threonine-protein kinase
VQHAHQKAIIHRDLKPANILVTEIDGQHVPRIIDFGLAKAATGANDVETAFTQVGHLVGTPAYMSPEQGDASVSDVDTRTDVYSLGVVLYVLLTGALPLDMKDWQQRPLEALRKLKDEEPAEPSARVSADRERSEEVASTRGLEPAGLVRMLRGDLDCIALKALEKDRERRYGSASDLGADIQRYLNHEAVIARPASAVYRLERYARRHRVGVAVVAGLVLLMAAFAIVQELQLRRITRERDRASRERDRATRITDFMTNMFKVPDPSEAHGNSVTAREILDKAAKDVGTGLAKDPQVRADMERVMAGTYANLGLYARGDDLAKKALDTRLKLLGPDNPMTLQSMTQLGGILAREGDYDGAEKMEREAFVATRRILGPSDPLTLDSEDTLAIIRNFQGHCDEEEKFEREVVELRTRTMGAEDRKTLLSMVNLANSIACQGRYAEAERADREAYQLAQRVFGPDDPEALGLMINLADEIHSQGRLSEAEPLLRQSLAASQRVLGPEHPDTLIALEDLAGVLGEEDRTVEAEKLYRDAWAASARTLGPDHPHTLGEKSSLAGVLVKEGKLGEAETLQRATLAAQITKIGPDNPDTLASDTNLAQILNREGRFREAEAIARQAYEAERNRQGPLHPDTIAALKQLSIALSRTHRYEEAATLFRQVSAQTDPGNDQANHSSLWHAFACVAVEANRPENALQYLRQSIELGYRDPDALMADSEFAPLRNDSRFQELVRQLRRQSASKNPDGAAR